MKKHAIIVLLSLTVLFLSGCTSALHDVAASYVTVQIKNFPLDGTYSLGGNFMTSEWTNDTRQVVIKNGTGSWTTPEMVIKSDFYFSLMTFGTWDRPWKTIKAATPQADTWEVTMPIDGGNHVITVDGSTNPMTATVE